MTEEFAKRWLERFPGIYLGLLRLKRRNHWSRVWIVERDTDVVIEGFPRSANSFARAAFHSVQPGLKYATHVHSSAQVVQACRWSVPAMVLLRNPEGAVCGLVAFDWELGGRNPSEIDAAAVDRVLRRYLDFYEPLERYRSDFFVAHFPEVVADFGRVMRGFNERFGKNHGAFSHTPESARALMDKSPHIGPQESREKIKSVVAGVYRNNASPELKKRAEKIYRFLAPK
jgi:hypothetical protein